MGSFDCAALPYVKNRGLRIEWFPDFCLNGFCLNYGFVTVLMNFETFVPFLNIFFQA